MIVFDASTLILLAKIDVLKLSIFNRKVVVSKEVERETTLRDEFLDAKIIKGLIKGKKIKVEKVTNQVLFKNLQKDFILDVGEASVLVLAYQKNVLLATDDRQAIKACKVLNINFVTAIHFLLKIYENKKISKELAMVKLDRLGILGRYSNDIMANAASRIKGGGV